MRKLAVSIAALGSLMVMTACGGSNSQQPPAANITGTWTVTLSRLKANNNCTGGLSDDGTFNLALTVDHPANSNSFTVTSSAPSFQSTGTISGSALSFAAAPTAFGCTPLAIDVTLTLDASGTAGTGRADWTCTNSGGTCGGFDTLTGTLQAP